MNKLAATTIVVFALVSSEAAADNSGIQELSGKIGRFRARLEALESNVRIALDQTGRNFNERLELGLNLFLADDFENSGIILDGLVRKGAASTRANRSQPRYFEAVYHLGRCYYEMDQMAASRAEFERIVEDRNERYLEPAVRYLIRIGARTRRWDRVDAHVATLKSMGGLRAETAYLYMKGLLSNGKPLQAKKTFSSIGQDVTEWYIKGKYLAGVADVALGNFDEAQNIFQELRSGGYRFADSEEVRNLAAMNVGRLFLERGDLTHAIDAYQDVSRESEHFERSLFETTWTFVRAAVRAEDPQVRKEEYLKAVRALDILLLSEAEKPIIPEARLLLGNIHLRRGDFDSATRVFTRVVDTYGPVKRELGYLTKEEAGAEEFYEEVVERQESSGSMLPELALEWAGDEQNFEVAQLVVQNLDLSDEWLRDSKDILETLRGVLGSREDRAAFFPRLRGVQGEIVEARNRLFTLRKDLVVIERRVFTDSFTAMENDELSKLDRQLQDMEPKYRLLPQRLDDYRTRAESLRSQLRDLRVQLLPMEIELANNQRELVELTKLLSSRADELEPEVVQEAQDLIDLAAEEVKASSAEIEQLKAQAQRTQDLISDTTELSTGAEELRAEYQRAVYRQQQISDGALARAQESDATRAIRGQLDVLTRCERQLNAMYEKLQSEVNVEATRMASELVSISGQLQENETWLNREKTSARAVVGQVAVDSMMQVEKKFDNILLRADVGIVDVAWAEKDSTTQEITSKVSEQRRELETFDREYREVLSDED